MQSLIGNWLRDKRNEKGLTQVKAGSLKAGFQAHEIGQIERGECFPSKRQVHRYAVALGVDNKEFETMWVEHLKELNKTRSNVLGEYLQGQREEQRINVTDMVRRIPSFSTADIRRVEDGSRYLTVIELAWFAIALEHNDMTQLLDMRKYDEIQRARLYFNEYKLFDGSDRAIKALELLDRA